MERGTVDTSREPVGTSEDMTNPVRFPAGKREQVSARVERREVKRLDHYAALLKALGTVTGEDPDVIEAIDRSHAAREAISIGLDVLLDKFGGWPETEEARQAQIAAVLQGKAKPRQ